MWIERKQPRRRWILQSVGRKSLRKIADDRIRNQGDQHVVVRLVKERWIVPRVWNAQRSSLIGGVENSVPGAHHSLVEQVVCDTDSGRKVIFLVGYQTGGRTPTDRYLREETRRQRVLPVPRDLQRIGIYIEIRLRAVPFFRVLDELVTQPKIQSQLLAYLEVILDVVELARLLKLIVDERGDLRAARHCAEQEIGRAQTAGSLVLYILCRECSAEPKISAGHGRLQDRKVHP